MQVKPWLSGRDLCDMMGLGLSRESQSALRTCEPMQSPRASAERACGHADAERAEEGGAALGVTQTRACREGQLAIKVGQPGGDATSPGLERSGDARGARDVKSG